MNVQSIKHPKHQSNGLEKAFLLACAGGFPSEFIEVNKFNQQMERNVVVRHKTLCD